MNTAETDNKAIDENLLLQLRRPENRKSSIAVLAEARQVAVIHCEYDLAAALRDMELNLRRE